MRAGAATGASQGSWVCKPDRSATTTVGGRVLARGWINARPWPAGGERPRSCIRGESKRTRGCARGELIARRRATAASQRRGRTRSRRTRNLLEFGLRKGGVEGRRLLDRAAPGSSTAARDGRVDRALAVVRPAGGTIDRPAVLNVPRWGGMVWRDRPDDGGRTVTVRLLRSQSQPKAIGVVQLFRSVRVRRAALLCASVPVKRCGNSRNGETKTTC